jgi:cell division control protein 24
MKQWETSITRLVKDTAARRASERAIQQVPHHPTSAHPQQHYVDRDRSSTQPGSQSYNSTPFPPYPPGAHGRAPGRQLTYHDEGISPFPKYVNNHPYGRSQSTEDFERDEDEDWVDTADDRGRYAAPYPVSGRGTPTGNGMNARRAGTPSSMQPPERDTNPAYYERLRARTEDQSGPVMTQFRNGLPPNGLPPMPVGRNPLGPRGLSNTSQMSQMSGMSEASFGTGVSSRAPRSQFSTTKLRQAYEAAEEKPTMPRYQQSQSMGAYPSQQHVRLRSASSPTAFPNRPSISDEVPPPVPPPSDVWGASSDSQGSVTSPEEKRGSNSSNSSSDYSIGQTASPVTPYGSSESNFAGATVRPARSQVFGSNESSGLTRVPSNKMPTMSFNPPVKVKVHYGEDLFVIVVPRSTDYTELVEKVGKKIRLCGGWKEDRPLRVKYRDEEGDMISLRDDDELQMAFETGAAESGKSQPTQITLFVV